VIIEGTGTLYNDMVCQPGRCYYHPADGKALSFSVPAEKLGPLRVAIAHKNCHLQLPTTFLRTPHGSLVGSTNQTPYPSSPRLVRVSADSLAAMQIGPADYVEVPNLKGEWS
jgi:mannose-6-phosphate isomerase